MTTRVSYARQTLDTPNPVARFTHRRRYVASVAIASQEAGIGATVLDYGCGHGDFLRVFGSERGDLHLLGYDPYSGHADSPAYAKIAHPEDIAPGTVDVLTIFETMEHLWAEEIDEFLILARELLRPAASLVISVPIIGGPPLFLKEANKMLLYKKRTDYTALELARAALRGLPAPRADDVKTSHKGFDFNALQKRVAGAGFELRREVHSPFTRLPWWLNSQAFFVFHRSSELQVQAAGISSSRNSNGRA